MTIFFTTPPPAPRIASMDHFRELTVVGIFVVHYASGFNWGVDLSAVFRHNEAQEQARQRAARDLATSEFEI
jgi:hypothetical protein